MQRQQDRSRHTGDDEAEKEAGGDLPIADPTEEGSAQAREAHVAETDPLRNGEEEGEEGPKGGGTSDEGAEQRRPAVGARRGQHQKRHAQAGRRVDDRRRDPQMLDVDGRDRDEARGEHAEGGQGPR